MGSLSISGLSENSNPRVKIENESGKLSKYVE